MLRNLERKETEYMRLQRRKVGMDDFEQLTVIGKGAFGEVHANDTFFHVFNVRLKICFDLLLSRCG